MCSVIIMNFNRDGYLKNNVLPKLIKYKNINEILISHGKKDTYFEYPDEKIRNFKDWDLNKKFGLTLRFITATRAKNDNTLIMDDDIIPKESTITFLLNKLKEERDTIHGIYGRTLKKDKEIYTYNTNLIFGECHIVLTRILMADKSLSLHFLNNYSDFETENIKNSKPYWNGEDILFNLLSIKKNNKLPKAYNLPHKNRNILNEIFKLGISGSDDHLFYRSEVSNDFVNKLSINDVVEKDIKNESRNNGLYEAYNSDLFYFILIFIIIIIGVLSYVTYKYLF